MKKILIYLTLMSISTSICAQTNYEKFKKLFKEKDTTQLETVISNWKSTQPNDPELYTSLFNYYIYKSKQEILSIEQSKPLSDHLQINDSLGNIAGYLSNNIYYNPEYTVMAMNVIDEGIKRFPNRLDMRFGKIYVLGMLDDYDNFTKNIKQTIDYSIQNNNKWLWTENAILKEAENIMLTSIQAYLTQLYETENDDLLPYMIEIGEHTIQHYPQNVEILSSTAVALMLVNNHEKAIYYLKKAEALDPTDCIVLNNIAHVYKSKGDKINAIKYYILTEKYGDEQAKQEAQENIKILQN
jgi:tetratricopeptide (TPR) repeat protein